MVLQPWLGLQVPYLQFFPAIMMAAWHGGLGPGALATVLSTLAAMYFFMPPDGFAVAGPAELTSLALFASTGLVISWLHHQWRHAEVRHGEAARLAETRARRLAAVVNTGVDGIIVIDGRGQVESFNRGAERLFGYLEAEVAGQNVSVLMPAPHREAHDGYLAQYLATGAARIIGVGRQVIGRRKDGSTFPLHLSVGEMNIDGERKFTGMLHDLSARVKLEDQLREQAALAKLGEMAAVIAHEVKNPLAGVRGAIEVIGRRLPAGSTEAAVIGEVIGRIDALNGMMRDMLLFARPPQPKLSPVNVSALVSASAELLRGDVACRGVSVDVTGAAPSISADGDLLRIVFLNLLVNGAHAMQGRGQIRVDVQSIDRTCRIQFRDHGPGMAEDVRARIFTPFFTTKSRGTGLGMPTVKRLIEAHHGSVTVECPPGGGTNVIVDLPLPA
jgi:two-component system sensor kinase FixL